MILLAMTRTAPNVPTALRPITDARGFVADISSADALGSIAPDASVQIVGFGLTQVAKSPAGERLYVATQFQDRGREAGLTFLEAR